jgi:serine/threonine-protein kinase
VGLPLLLEWYVRIVEQIGAGGMGVVYLARDLDLERDVAVKLLPPELVRSPERLAAFRGEARALASLNHPGIASIHRIVEPKRGAPFLVLELIEGVTLASRLKGGALPLHDALGVCSQIAEALGAAHDRGVVHRDLKPGNVMISGAGRVKILPGRAPRLRRLDGHPGADGDRDEDAGLGRAPRRSVPFRPSWPRCGRTSGSYAPTSRCSL